MMSSCNAMGGGEAGVSDLKLLYSNEAEGEKLEHAGTTQASDRSPTHFLPIHCRPHGLAVISYVILVKCPFVCHILQLL